MDMNWIKAALVRAVKTMAQTAVALIGTGAMGILDVDWIAVLSASALAGIISILTSIAGLPEVDAQNTIAIYDEYEASDKDEEEEEEEEDE